MTLKRKVPFVAVRLATLALAFVLFATTLYLPMRELAVTLPFSEGETSERATSEQEERDGLDELRGSVSVLPTPQPPRGRTHRKVDRARDALASSHLSLGDARSRARARTGPPPVLRLRI